MRRRRPVRIPGFGTLLSEEDSKEQQGRESWMCLDMGVSGYEEHKCGKFFVGSEIAGPVLL